MIGELESMTQTCNNKYSVDISGDSMLRYCDGMVSDCYKLLGIFEGKDPITKKVIYDKYDAYGHYMRYLDNFCVEIWGAYEVFSSNEHFMKLAITLEGMKKIGIDEHHKLRPLVFNCISLCKKVKGVVEREFEVL